MNHAQIAGHLGADAEERFTANGKRVIALRVAARAWHSGKEETIWWKVNIWGDRFDKLIPYLRKGTAVIVFGEMNKPETYVDREGKTQVSLALSAESVRLSPFGKSNKSSETNPSNQYSQNQTYSMPQQSGPSSFDTSSQEMAGFGVGMSNDLSDTSDDLPF